MKELIIVGVFCKLYSTYIVIKDFWSIQMHWKHYFYSYNLTYIFIMFFLMFFRNSSRKKVVTLHKSTLLSLIRFSRSSLIRTYWVFTQCIKLFFYFFDFIHFYIWARNIGNNISNWIRCAEFLCYQFWKTSFCAINFEKQKVI